MATKHERGGRATAIWISAGLIALSLAAFHGVGGFEFVGLDDPAYVSQNPHVRAGLSAESLGWSLTTGYWGNWHPLVWWSHLLVAEIFGLRPGPHHVANLLLHAACAVVLFVALRRMSGQPWPSALVAALFAVHPLHVESVAWVSARKDTLSTLFWWLTVLLWARRVERPTPGRTAAALAAYGAGLASKSMLVTLPFALLLFDVWPLQRIPGSGTAHGRRAALRTAVVEKWPLFAMAAVASTVALWAQRGAGAVQGLAGTAAAERVANALVSYAIYLRRTIWPADLAVYYPQVDRGAGETATAVALLLAISVGVWLARRRVPAIGVGWLFFLGTLVPVIGLVQIGAQALADRYTYLPLTGLFIAVVWGGRALLIGVAGRSRAAIAGGAIAAILLLACVAGTRSQLATWRDSHALYRHALAVTQDNYFIHGMYGTWLLQRRSHEAAIEQLRTALTIRPRFLLGLDNLGIALTDTGRQDEAIEQFERALEIDPRRVRAHRGRAAALLRAGRLDEAIAGFERALELSPGDETLRADLARARAAR